MIRSTSLVFALALFQACPPTPAPPGPLDASRPAEDASTAASAACANLSRLGCAEGMAGNCAVTIDHVTETRLTRIDVACLSAATSKAAVRACGGVKCE